MMCRHNQDSGSDLGEVERTHTGNTLVQVDIASCSLVLL